MSEHLPECVASMILTVDQTGQRYVSCVCPALRACEQRVRQAIVAELVPYRASGRASANVLRVVAGLPPVPRTTTSP